MEGEPHGEILGVGTHPLGNGVEVLGTGESGVQVLGMKSVQVFLARGGFHGRGAGNGRNVCT